MVQTRTTAHTGFWSLPTHLFLCCWENLRASIDCLAALRGKLDMWRRPWGEGAAGGGGGGAIQSLAPTAEL